MAQTPIYKWRLPEGTDQPVVHVDMSELAGDIETTMSTAPLLLPGFPKQAAVAGNVNGWIGSQLRVMKYQVAENLYEYKFTGYIGRSSNLTLAANSVPLDVPNFLIPEVNINAAMGVNVFFPGVLHGGGAINDVQLIFAGRNLQIRNRSTITYATNTVVSVAGVSLYGTT